MSITYRRLPILIAHMTLALLCLGLTGCGLTVRQRAAISKFSATTTALAGQVEENLIQTRDDVVALRTGMFQLGVTGVSQADLDGGLDVKQLEKRLRAAAALKRFGRLLETLATDTQTGELQAASDNFVTSLRQVQGVNVSDAKAEAIGQVIARVGGLFIEAKRKKALQSVIIESQKPLLKLADLMAEDASPTNAAWLGLLVATDKSIQTTLARRASTVVAGSQKSAEVKWGDAEAALWQERYQGLQMDSAARSGSGVLISEGTLKAIAKFRSAQEDLFVIIQSSGVSLDKIDGYYAEIDELLRLSRILSNKERK